MPYIKQNRRHALNITIEALVSQLATRGEYNYAITRLIHSFIQEGVMGYSVLNDAVGILECAKQELIRTVVSPYEDEKIAENGPINVLKPAPKNPVAGLNLKLYPIKGNKNENPGETQDS